MVFSKVVFHLFYVEVVSMVSRLLGNIPLLLELLIWANTQLGGFYFTVISFMKDQWVLYSLIFCFMFQNVY